MAEECETRMLGIWAGAFAVTAVLFVRRELASAYTAKFKDCVETYPQDYLGFWLKIPFLLLVAIGFAGAALITFIVLYVSKRKIKSRHERALHLAELRIAALKEVNVQQQPPPKYVV